jgi:hypothetical protein
MEVKKNRDYVLREKDCLWRYIDLHQLLYFLNTETIFFAPLSSFEDPLEGISERYLNQARLRSLAAGDQVNSNKLKHAQELVYASCWFLGDTESMAMWETHSNPDSVAIEFNANYLVKLMAEKARKFQSDHFPVFSHGKVNYIQLSPVDERQLKDHGEQMAGFLKDKSYRHEEEFRFLVFKRTDHEFFGFGLPVGSLEELDFRIIAHPRMLDWKKQNLEKVLKNFCLQDKLKKSTIILKT